MEAKGAASVVVKKTSPTPKALIHQKFGDKACYKVEELQESSSNGCPGLAIPQKGPSLYRCCLQLPEFSVVSGTFKRKREAEQSAAEMALQKLGISSTNDIHPVQDPFEELVGRLSYLFSDKFISCVHPLSGHFREALHRKGQLNGLVPILVLIIYDAKLNNLCKSIDPKVESDPLLVVSLLLKAAAKLSGYVSALEEQRAMRRENPYPPEILLAVSDQNSTSPELIGVEVIRIPSSREKIVESFPLRVALNDYYLDVIAEELGLSDASELLVSRSIGKASSEMRLYSSAHKSRLGNLSSESPHPMKALKQEVNDRASYLCGHPIYGDAILASIGYTWKSTDLFYEDVSLRTYHRMLINKTPAGVYKLSRDAALVAELPGAFTTRSNWRGSYPRDLLCTFCRQNRLSEPIFSTINVPTESPGSCKSSMLTESGNGENAVHGNGTADGKTEDLRGAFRCEVKVFSKSQALLIECSPNEIYKKQNDAVQNTALKILLWLNEYFKNLHIPSEQLTSLADASHIQFSSRSLQEEFAMCKSVYNFKHSSVAHGGRMFGSDCMIQVNCNIDGPDSGVSPSNGSLVCIAYTIYLVTKGDDTKELIESNAEFEFEIGNGAVLSSLESIVTQMSVGQSSRFCMQLPPQEFILASGQDSLKILSLLTSKNCTLEYAATLTRVTEPLEDRMEQALFSPPLSKQRVEYAVHHIEQSCATSLVDFGCGSGSLLESLLDYPTSLEKIVGVDISRKSLARAAKVLHSKLNKISDGISPSKGVKSVLLYDGSITCFDSRLYGFDIGTCLEVIEHMEEDQACLFGDVVLSCFCPRILIVSTPNYEYNVILQRSSLQSQEEDPDDHKSCKFRNHDHKFEWTREQFNRWASDLAARHKYRVEFSGVGGAADVEPGFASQIAVFRKGEECSENKEAAAAAANKYQSIWEWSCTDSEQLL